MYANRAILTMVHHYKVSPDWICAVTSRFTKLFYCEGANIAHIQSGVTLELCSVARPLSDVKCDNIDLSHWYKVDKVFYTPEAKLRCVKITSYITKRS